MLQKDFLKIRKLLAPLKKELLQMNWQLFGS